MLGIKKEEEMNLETMEKLEKCATSGPWESAAYFVSKVSNEYEDESSQVICETREDNTEDAEFIAASRDWIPWAIERIRELEEYEWKYKDLCK